MINKQWLYKNRYLIGTVALVGIIWYFSRKKKNGTRSLSNSSKVLVCSHIAAIDSKSGTKAENNLKNIQLLLDENIDIIEVDVQITKDNVPVLFHDKTLDSKTNGSGSIKDLTWSQLQTVRYNSDSSQGIAKLSDAIQLLKKSGKKAIFQLDKCDKNEIAKIDSLGLFKGVESQILVKALSFKAPDSVIKAGIVYMPMLPNNYVGKMTNENTINEIVNNCKGYKFLEAQFSDSDTLLINGTLAKKLKEIGCRLFVVAVPGAKTTNSPSFRGDSQKQWSKMIEPMGAGAIMTNKPLALKQYLISINK